MCIVYITNPKNTHTRTHARTHAHTQTHTHTHTHTHTLLTTNMVFVQKRSSETQLFQTFHSISKSLDEKKYVDMVILEFTKAIDKVPYKRLIHKLKYCDITGPISS